MQQNITSDKGGGGLVVFLFLFLIRGEEGIGEFLTFAAKGGRGTNNSAIVNVPFY